MVTKTTTITIAEAAVRKYDAVIVPGGGLDPDSGAPRPWVCARLDAAARLDKATRYHIVLSRGTPHRSPPACARGFPIDEAAASAAYLLAAGVADPSRILLDSWSLDTIGNAYFTRQALADPLKLRTLLVITSSFHMPRTRAIFDWVFGLPLSGVVAQPGFSVDYCVTEDIGMTPEDCASRVEKELASLATLTSKTIPRITCMRELATFVFVEHGAYNSAPRLPPSIVSSNLAASTY
jgi:hypothetical protein